MNLYLDDKRTPEMSFTSFSIKFEIVRTYDEFCDFIDRNITSIEFISFDHDLADFNHTFERTGLDCVNHLIEVCMDRNIELPGWYVHSDNTSGRENMISKLVNYMKIVEGKDVTGFNHNHRGFIKSQFI